MEAKLVNARAMKTLKRSAFVAVLACAVASVSVFTPGRVIAQERLKIIYSQFTMTNSATWFAREAGLFERHGLTADLIYVDSTPAVQASRPDRHPGHDVRWIGRWALLERPRFGHAGWLVQFELVPAYHSSRDPASRGAPWKGHRHRPVWCRRRLGASLDSPETRDQ